MAQVLNLVEFLISQLENYSSSLARIHIVAYKGVYRYNLRMGR